MLWSQSAQAHGDNSVSRLWCSIRNLSVGVLCVRARVREERDSVCTCMCTYRVLCKSCKDDSMMNTYCHAVLCRP